MEVDPSSSAAATAGLSCTYNYVVNAQKPTAVSHAAVGHFTSPSDTNLILA